MIGYIVAFIGGVAVGSFFPQPEFFKKYWDKLVSVFKKDGDVDT